MLSPTRPRASISPTMLQVRTWRLSLALLLEACSGGRASACRGRRRRTRSGRSIPVGSPDPELVGHALDDRAVRVGALADFEEVGVRGDLQRFDEPDRAEVGLAGVAELLGAPTCDALARAEPFARRDDAPFERRHRRDRLERGAGRVGAVDGAVGQRPAGGAAAAAGPRIRPCVSGLANLFGSKLGSEPIARICPLRGSIATKAPAGAGLPLARASFHPFPQRLFALLLQAQVERHLEAVPGQGRRLGRGVLGTGSRSALTSTRCTPVLPRR